MPKPPSSRSERARIPFAAVVPRPDCQRLRRLLTQAMTQKILRYFQIRRKWEEHEYVVPVTADFEFLNEAGRRLPGERFESLYQAWFSGRIAENARSPLDENP